MLKLLTVVFMVLAGATTVAQQVPVTMNKERMAETQARQFAFTHFTITQGLASNFVNNIVQDHKGYIWLATANGLQRYDGNKFTRYNAQAGNQSRIPEDNVALVYADKKNRLWLATSDNKVGIFNTDKLTYKEAVIRYKSEFTLYVPKKLVETAAGELLLFVMGDGPLKYNEATNTFEYNAFDLPVPRNWRYTDICEDYRTGRFWIASDSGVALYDPKLKQLSYRGNNLANDPLISRYGNITHVSSIYQDTSGRCLIVSWGPKKHIPTLFYQDLKTNESRSHDLSVEALGVNYYEIQGARRQANGKLWIYGLPFLMEYGAGGKPLNVVKNDFSNDDGVRFEKVNDVFEDNQRNLWVSTNNGIFYFNPDAQMFNSYDLVRPDGKGMIKGITQSVCQLSNGTILVGCWGAGLYAYDKNFSPATLPRDLDSIKDNYTIWCILQHSATGKVWMGLQGGGLIVYDPAAEKHKTWFPEVFRGRTIRVVVEDKAGNLWFGTQGGLVVKWDRQLAGDNFTKGFSVITETGLVHKLFVAKDGLIWVATLGRGLLKIDPSLNAVVDQFRKKDKPGQEIWSDGVADIAQRNDSILLIAAGALDMINMRTRKVVHISSDDGLPGNNINCMVRDRNGIFWLGSFNGLCRFNIDIGTFTTYDRRDGISYDAFGPGDAHSLPDGRLIFTNNQNFLGFDPLKMVQSKVPPDAVITDFRIGNESLSIDSIGQLKKIVLPYDKNSVVIEFSALNYLKEQKLHYHYQLQNLETEIQEADEKAQAIYSYLPPGEYTFNVMTENADGITSKKITSLVIQIRAPFWKTWWFYAMLLLAIASILFWLERERIKKFVELQQVRTQIAGNLHKELDTTLNNISMLSEMAKIKADKDITRSKEYIDQINEKSRKMIIVMDDMFWSIDPANDSMEMTLLRMNEFVSAMRNRHSANIEMVVDENVQNINLDMKARYEFYVIFRRALRSIARSSMANQILINIDFNKDALFLKIQSNGAYGSPDALYDNEKMTDISRRAESLNAVMDIQADNKHVSLILEVPLA